MKTHIWTMAITALCAGAALGSLIVGSRYGFIAAMMSAALLWLVADFRSWQGHHRYVGERDDRELGRVIELPPRAHAIDHTERTGTPCRATR